MATYKTFQTLTGCMAGVPLAEAWLLRRARDSRTGSDGISIGEEEFLDALANHPLFAEPVKS